jgi:demethylmenaquinone methyltransferase/2-methoxy-6-polyprenyl-1,4-benzoquinol methylase
MSEQIRVMFSEIAPSYDIGNDLLSFGVHRLWKQRLVRAARPKPGDRVLDLATGTGDIALLFSKAVAPGGEVVGIDFCRDMIEQAKTRERNKGHGIDFEVGDAMSLRFADDSFDIATISFGIRNVDDPVKALSEMRRVVRPGGRVVVLEFGQPRGLFGSFYSFYSGTVCPILGGIVSGHKDAYDYLNRTSAAFPCREAFVDLMHRAGIRNVRWEPLFNGVAFLYVGEVEESGSLGV